MIKKIGVSALIGFAIFFALALGLIVSQDLVDPAEFPKNSSSKGLDFTEIASSDALQPPPLTNFTARDGARLDYRLYPSTGPTNKLLVLVHGSGWHSQQFVELAHFIANAGLANVVTPDLRGHGVHPKIRGDIVYIGQFEDDLMDLMRNVRKQYPAKTIILGGHSSGGGLVVRLAGSAYGPQIDAFLLMAPFLKYNAETTRENSGGWARPLTRRIIGLSMLNSVGISALNHLPVIQFNMPEKVRSGPLGQTATLHYSYRLNTAYAPRSDFTSDLAAMTQPFLLLAGSADEAFFAEQYEPVISAQTPSGLYEIVPGVSHLGIVQDTVSHYLIADWIKELAP